MQCICIHCIGWLLNQLLFRLLGRDLSYQIGKAGHCKPFLRRVAGIDPV